MKKFSKAKRNYKKQERKIMKRQVRRIGNTELNSDTLWLGNSELDIR